LRTVASSLFDLRAGARKIFFGLRTDGHLHQADAKFCW
jgi:hypothetical protein